MTRPLRSALKMPSIRSAYWAFTRHGTHEELVEFAEQVKYLTGPKDHQCFVYSRFQEEQTEKGGLHLQGMVQCKTRMSLKLMKEICGKFTCTRAKLVICIFYLYPDTTKVATCILYLYPPQSTYLSLLPVSVPPIINNRTYILYTS